MTNEANQGRGEHPVTTEDLIDLFDGFPEMAREALARNTHRPVSTERTTLDAIGKHYGVTRERVRQVQVAARRTFSESVRQVLGSYESLLVHNDATNEIVDIELLSDVISPDTAGAVIATEFLVQLGFEPLEPAPRLWCRNQGELREALKSIHIEGPIPRAEWKQRLADIGISQDLLTRINGTPSVLVVGEFVIRADRERADRVTLILNELGGEATTEQILDFLPEDVSGHALSSYLSRYPQFARNNVRRVWTFAASDSTPRYSSALAAILDILNSEGPLDRKDLRERIREVHPVTDWRITQCLTDSRIGRMPDGRIWLVEHGAVRDVEPEPAQPQSMSSVNSTVGVRLTVDNDFLRGSGLNVQRWLSWKLGLSSVPSEMRFSADNDSQLVVTVRSIHAGSTISSLREIARREALVEGCQVVILFKGDSRLWDYRHICEPRACPKVPGTTQA